MMTTKHDSGISGAPFQMALYAALALLVAVLLGVGLAQVFLRHVGHDQAWCLYAADLVLKGTRLSGPHLVEVNPPFIIWFSCIPVLLGQLLHIGILNGFRLFFDLTALISLAWTTSLIRRVLRAPSVDLWAFSAMQVIVAFWLIGRDSLGQREHLLVLLVLPYLVWCAGRAEAATVPRAERVTIGLVAAVAVCLKPQHLLSIVLIELFFLLRKRNLAAWFDISVAAFAAGLVAYGLSVVIFGRAYVQNTLPLLRLTYSGMNEPLRALTAGTTPKAIIVALIVGWLAMLFTGERCGYRSLLFVLGLAGTGSLLAYLQQHKGWSYQLIPAGMFTFLFMATLLLSLAHRMLPLADMEPRWRPGLLYATGLLCVISLGCMLRFGRRSGYFEKSKDVLAHFYAPLPSGAAVAFISTQPWEMPVVIEQHKVLGQRLNYFWLLPAIIYSSDPADTAPSKLSATQIEQLSEYQRRIMAEDLAHWRPALVVVNQCGPDLCNALRRESTHNLLDWFLRDPRFANEWTHYRFQDAQGDLESYRRIN